MKKMLKFGELCILNCVYDKCKISILRRAYHAKSKLKHVSQKRPIISCKRKEYDFYPVDYNTNNKIDNIKLASKGWHHNKSIGDYFIFHMSDEIQTLDQNTAFNQFGLNEKLISNLESQKITQPTFIQSKAIPLLLARKNVLVAAETGCGKTLAYLLPALQQIIEAKSRNQNSSFNSPTCLILTPGRELAYQIEYVAQNILKDININTEVIVGGGTKKKMLNPTFKEIDLLVATLGAISKLTTSGIYKMEQVRHVILDEADTLLDESFSAKLAHFLKKFPFYYAGGSEDNFLGTQLTLVSATMPTSLPPILSEVIVPESLTRVTTDQLHRILPHVPQRFVRLGKTERAFQLLQIVKADAEKNYPVMIFTNTSNTCDWASMFLNENGINCVNLNGDMSLQLRKNKFVDFQTGIVNVISCTDIGSRGLDTTRVKHVINFDFPKYSADYIHRCGRIGRIGSPQNCHVTNFISGFHEVDLLQKIEMAVRRQECLPNVNANIAGIIRHKMMKSLKEIV